MILTEKMNSTPALNELVDAEKLQLLFRQSYPAIFISIFNALVLTAILWSVQDHSLLLGWFITLLGTALVRLYIFTRYRKLLPQGQDVLSWEKPYFITLLLSSLAWGVGGMVILPVDSPLHQAAIFAFLIGMSGGAISVYSTHRLMTLSTIAILLLPVTTWFVIRGDMIFTGLAIASIVFFLSSIRATRSISSTLHQNLLMTHELKRSKEEAEKLARIDELTGLYNRRAFYELGKVLVSQAQRNKEPLAMIMMDIDNFKLVNDRFGHAAGDIALQEIGNIMCQRLRKSDVFARIGGEEFALLLPATTTEQAMQLADELRMVISGTDIRFGEQHFSLTASFGVTSGDSDIDTLARQADNAMYQSKDSGRNTVICDQVDNAGKAKPAD